jgi:hypothetical protein
MSALPARSGETGTGGPSKMRPAPARPHANTLPPRSRLLGSTLRGPPGWTAPRSSTASRARSDMQPDRLSVCSRSQVVSGAGDGVRTRDIQLGKLTLCQLSYSRSGDGQFTDRWLGRQAVSRAGGRRHGSPRGRSWAREGLVSPAGTQLGRAKADSPLGQFGVRARHWATLPSGQRRHIIGYPSA